MSDRPVDLPPDFQTFSSDVIDIIENRYHIVEMFDILYFYNRLPDLVNLFHKYKDACFADNERLVILHHDTDYYASQTSTGNSIYNLFTLIADFNIPCEKIIFLTNHHGIENEIIEAAKNICFSESPLVICTNQWFDYPSLDDLAYDIIDYPNKDILQLYHCMNKKCRSHRVFLLCCLAEAGLLDQGVVSYHFAI
jgi:hypothetical protein